MTIRWRGSWVRNGWNTWGFQRTKMTDLQKQQFRWVLYLGRIFIAATTKGV